MSAPVDWNEVKRRFEGSSLSSRVLGSQFGVSHTAINKRAHNEGWQRKDPDSAPLRAPLPEPPAEVICLPDSLVLGERSAANAQSILASVGNGAPVSVAAKAVGFTDDGLESWLKDDTDFCERLEATAAYFVCGMFSSIKGAAERGQYQAASWFLERSHLTKKQYGKQASETGGITVNISIRGEDKPPIIDVTKGTTIEHVSNGQDYEH